MRFLRKFSRPQYLLFSATTTTTSQSVEFVADIHRRCLNTSSSQQLNQPVTFVTTPIFYVNSVPHIGHLYTTVFADALCRFSKLVNVNQECIFSTGTDEHGLKVQRSAEAAGEDTQTYCDRVAIKFRDLFTSCDIDYTHFNRTSDQAHKLAVQSLWQTLAQKGFIYRENYSGYYSVNDECFVPESAVTTNQQGAKVVAESGQPVEWLQEENYMFRLSAVQRQLTDWIDHQLILKPDNFYATLKADLDSIKHLKHISISRSNARLKWGVEVPGDSSQVIYVWFDALINYLTAAGYPNSLTQWPPCHVIGKDILKFHAIYWPAFLLAAELEPPKLIYCHSHWLYNEQKMSKSKGNVVDPYECIARFTPDGIRFFLLKEGTPHSDSNFSIDKVRICLNADLANTFGNLLNRCTSAKLNIAQRFPYCSRHQVLQLFPEAAQIIEISDCLAKNCYRAYLDGNFYIGITQVLDFLRLVNGLLTKSQPWHLVGSDANHDQLDTILYLALESIRVSSILLQPVIPHTSRAVLDKLNVGPELRTWSSAENAFADQDDDIVNKQLAPHKYMLFSKLR